MDLIGLREGVGLGGNPLPRIRLPTTSLNNAGVLKFPWDFAKAFHSFHVGRRRKVKDELALKTTQITFTFVEVGAWVILAYYVNGFDPMLEGNEESVLLEDKLVLLKGISRALKPNVLTTMMGIKH
ncbi:hypothetical protein CFP56_009002 [Quercus suber]|uniref:Uncharacterized protein n=1 Tax=Quercus suber TaxID=58331 RepID=A0AAW0L4G5_QUESU